MCSCFVGRRRHCISQHRHRKHHRLFPPYEASPLSGHLRKAVRSIAPKPIRAKRISGHRSRLSRRAQPSQKIGHRATLWAEAVDHSGRSSEATLSTQDPYDFTANSALEISSRIGSLRVALGLVTPSQAFGADFVLSLPGCSRVDIPPPNSNDGRQSDV